MRTGILVSDAMTRKLITISPESSSQECAQAMMTNKVGGLIVHDGEQAKGIVTEHDLVDKVLAKNTDRTEVKVSDIMSTKLLSVEPSADLSDAMSIMANEGVRRLPVVYNGNVVGILTAKDILKIEPQLVTFMAEKFSVRDEHEKSAFMNNKKKE